MFDALRSSDSYMQAQKEAHSEEIRQLFEKIHVLYKPYCKDVKEPATLASVMFQPVGDVSRIPFRVFMSETTDPIDGVTITTSMEIGEGDIELPPSKFKDLAVRYRTALGFSFMVTPSMELFRYTTVYQLKPRTKGKWKYSQAEELRFYLGSFQKIMEILTEIGAPGPT